MFYKNTIKLVTIISFVYCSFATLSASSNAMTVKGFVDTYQKTRTENLQKVGANIAKRNKLMLAQLVDLYFYCANTNNTIFLNAVQNETLQKGYAQYLLHIAGKLSSTSTSASASKSVLTERLVALNALLDELLKFKELKHLQADNIGHVKQVTDFIKNDCEKLYDATLKFADKAKAVEALRELKKMTKRYWKTNTQSSTVDHWHQLYIAAQAAASPSHKSIKNIIHDVGVAVAAAAKTGVTSREQRKILKAVAKMTGGNTVALKDKLRGLTSLRRQLRSILGIIENAGIKGSVGVLNIDSLCRTLGWDGHDWEDDSKVPTTADFDAVKDAIKRDIEAGVAAAKAAGVAKNADEINILNEVAKMTGGNSKGLVQTDQLLGLMNLRKQLRNILVIINSAGIKGSVRMLNIDSLGKTLGYDASVPGSWKDDSEVPTMGDFNAVKNVIKRDIEAGVVAVAAGAGGITLNALKTAVGVKNKDSLKRNIKNLDKYITLPANWKTDMTVLSELIVDIVASYTAGMDYLAGPQGLGNGYLKLGATAAPLKIGILGVGDGMLLRNQQSKLHYLRISQNHRNVSPMKDGLLNLKKQFVTDLNPK